MSTMTIERLMDAFELLTDWQERYDYISELGAKLPPMPEAEKTDESRVHGCISKVWVTGRATGDPLVMEYRADGEGPIIRGLVALLYLLFQGRSREEVLDLDAEGVIEKLGLDENLSPNRHIGMYAMVEKFKGIARTARP
ncbi:MAG: SufE family protein [Gammaproteobacteria bacterium]|jgi:cysteine desulfuration protein SufE|nr:SufE family protein [Gammaproteobacteria bacterium]